MINHGLLQNSDSFAKPKNMPTEEGGNSCTNRLKIQIKEKLKEATLKNWENSSILHQCGSSPITRHRLLNLLGINNWLRI